ncbi:hypothetical protein LY78DRAFT_657769 [Colletotrichum sublineola]|nr:hypothetical protein LY78DRAFT_657769 [Colletotrichum sublineola]
MTEASLSLSLGRRELGLSLSLSGAAESKKTGPGVDFCFVLFALIKLFALSRFRFFLSFRSTTRLSDTDF